MPQIMEYLKEGKRVFIISIRKDIDKGFNFPAPFPLTKSLKDVLENEVEDRYFMRDDKVKDYIKHFKSVTPYGTERMVLVELLKLIIIKLHKQISYKMMIELQQVL